MNSHPFFWAGILNQTIYKETTFLIAKQHWLAKSVAAGWL